MENESTEILNKKENFIYFDDKGRPIYKIDLIVDHINSLNKDKLIAKFICEILSEKKIEIIVNTLREIGKDELLNVLTRSLIIQNEGGMEKKGQISISESMKTTGGILMGILRKELSNEQKKKIFPKRDNKKKNLKKKLNHQLNKLEL